ncbi:MAG TPA: hypothetical protein VFE05_02670 [Longimicrobiaceae bacterium]|nr:hypothetical protein [Longimicrobiaceae bacterium]
MDFFYDGALRDGNAPREGRVVLLDTRHTPARATTRWVKMSASRQNLVHRGIVGSLLWSLREAQPRASILVLSPFVAQKKAYEREASTGRVPSVRFATVHSSQGPRATSWRWTWWWRPGGGARASWTRPEPASSPTY